MNNDQKRATNIWARRIHVYTSMITFVIVLFFGITGITLNHPQWTFGDENSITTAEGVFPFEAVDEAGSVDLLAIAEHARTDHGVSGDVADYQVADDGQGSIAFKKPGYGADILFDATDGTYELTVEQQGWVAVFNDLHKGRDSGSTWSWVIDLSAGFLVVVSLSGLVMQLVMRKRRRAALISAAAGTVVTVALMAMALL